MTWAGSAEMIEEERERRMEGVPLSVPVCRTASNCRKGRRAVGAARVNVREANVESSALI